MLPRTTPLLLLLTNLLLLLFHPPQSTNRLLLIPSMLMSTQVQPFLALSDLALRPHRVLTRLVRALEDCVHGFELVAVGFGEEPEDDGHVHVVEAHEDEVGLPRDFVDHDGGELDDACEDQKVSESLLE